MVLDVNMPERCVFEAASDIVRRSPRTRVVFVSAFSPDRFIERALQVPASGYVTKSDSLEAVMRAVHAAVDGETFYSDDILARLVVGERGVRTRVAAPVESRRGASLTPREVEVLRYVARGLSKKEVASIMNISVHTVNRHTTGLMGKLAIHDRVELARYAFREGLAEP